MQIKFLDLKNMIFEMKSILDGINSVLNTVE